MEDSKIEIIVNSLNSINIDRIFIYGPFSRNGKIVIKIIDSEDPKKDKRMVFSLTLFRLYSQIFFDFFQDLMIKYPTKYYLLSKYGGIPKFIFFNKSICEKIYIDTNLYLVVFKKRMITLETWPIEWTLRILLYSSGDRETCPVSKEL